MTVYLKCNLISLCHNKIWHQSELARKSQICTANWLCKTESDMTLKRRVRRLLLHWGVNWSHPECCNETIIQDWMGGGKGGLSVDAWSSLNKLRKICYPLHYSKGGEWGKLSHFCRPLGTEVRGKTNLPNTFSACLLSTKMGRRVPIT